MPYLVTRGHFTERLYHQRTGYWQPDGRGLEPATAAEQPGLLRHPASITLAGLRRTAPHRLMEQYQQFDPFKFLIYAELAGAEIGPVE